MKLWGLLIAVASLVACGGGDDFAARTCTPGITQECACPGGVTGAQACSADGNGYEACQCAVGSGGSSGAAGAGQSGSAGSGGATGGAAGNSAGGSAGSGASGAAGAAGAGGSVPPFYCSSGVRWPWGETKSADMTPGRACQQCHAQHPSSPQFTISGTVYNLERESDDCNGVSGVPDAGTRLQIAVLNEMGAEVIPRITPNAVGNFYTDRLVPQNYYIKLIYGTKELRMLGGVTGGGGDCNGCHSEQNRIHL